MSHHGAVRSTVRADAAYQVTTETRNGSVSVDVPEAASAHTIDATTDNGSIAVHSGH